MLIQANITMSQSESLTVRLACEVPVIGNVKVFTALFATAPALVKDKWHGSPPSPHGLLKSPPVLKLGDDHARSPSNVDANRRTTSRVSVTKLALAASSSFRRNSMESITLVL